MARMGLSIRSRDGVTRQFLCRPFRGVAFRDSFVRSDVYDVLRVMNDLSVHQSPSRISLRHGAAVYPGAAATHEADETAFRFHL